MSVPERNRCITVVVVFVIGLTVVGVLVNRSMSALAQETTFITVRPQFGSSQTYEGCNDQTLSATVNADFAFDSISGSFATTYTDADFSPETDPDVEFSQSGLWSIFNQQTTCMTNVYLYVLRSAVNNTQAVRQWTIEYDIDGSGWHEMVRFTINYKNASGSIDLEDEKVVNTTLNEEGFIKDIDGTQLTLERYYPNEFTPWAENDDIETVGGSFTAQVDAPGSEIVANPEAGEEEMILGGAYLITDPPADYLDTNLQVRTTTRQRGCSDQCNLCEGTALAVLNIHEIYTDSLWDEVECGPCPLIIITDEVLPTANVYVDYNEWIEAKCGVHPYTWQYLDGDLPPEFVFTWIPGSSPYDLDITYDYDEGPPEVATDPGTYEFTVRVSDDSGQYDQRQFVLVVEGVGISPCNAYFPEEKGKLSDSWTFTPLGPGTPYYWCRTGTLPPGMSLENSSSNAVPLCPANGIPEETADYQEDTALTLDGTPINDGSYPFSITILSTADGGGLKKCTYTVVVRAKGATLQPKKLKEYLQGVPYDIGNPDALQADFILATDIDNLGAAGDIYIIDGDATGVPDDTDLPGPLDGLYLDPGGDDAIPLDIPLPASEGYRPGGVFQSYIKGTIAVTNTAAGFYAFMVGIDDPGNFYAAGDMQLYVLPVLERKTVILKGPPAAVELPADNKLTFVTWAEGGAPGSETDTDVNVDEEVHYGYTWEVTSIGEDSPELGTASGGPGTASPRPKEISITFTDSDGEPVVGTYEIEFTAQDVLWRRYGTADYKFTPATVRIKVIKSLEQDAERPIKQRQETFE